MEITSDRKILDMVEHCHLEFTEHPYQQYPKPPVRFNSEEAALIDGEIPQLLNKGVLRRLTLVMVSMSLQFFSEKRKMVLTD